MTLDGHVDVTHRLVGAAIAVQTVLGSGLAERIYRSALAVELRSRPGLVVSEEHPVEVFYRGRCVGKQVLDLVVRAGGLFFVIEAKHFRAADDTRWELAKTQLATYLAALESRVGLVINFGVHPIAPGGIRRVVNPALREVAR